MTKYEADNMLKEQLAELENRIKSTDNTTEEYVRLLDALLAVYAMLVKAGGFEELSFKADNGGIVN